MKHLRRDLFGFLAILERLRIPYAVIGGLAVGYWSKERFTRDADLTLSLPQRQWERLQGELLSDGRVVISQIAMEAGFASPYLIRIKYRDTPLDLITSLTEFQESLLKRRVRTRVGDKRIFIASPEDIIVSKLIAARPQDEADVKTMLVHLKKLDRHYISRWAKIWEVTERWKKWRRSPHSRH